MATEFRQTTPVSVEETPLWAMGTALQPVRIDETTLLSYNGAYVGWWGSQPIWKDPQPGRLAVLRHVVIKYASEGVSSFLCWASPNGGEDWYESNPTPLATVEHHQGVNTVDGHWDFVQGHDLRVRICFTDPEVVIVKGMIAELIVRGRVLYREFNYAP